MSSNEKLLFEHFLKPEALFKTNDGLLIAQPDVSRQQYYNIEYDDILKNNKTQPKYQQRNSTANINTSIITQLWNETDNSTDDYSTDSSIDSDDDDDDIDWKCCGHNISFLNEYNDNWNAKPTDNNHHNYNLPFTQNQHKKTTNNTQRQHNHNNICNNGLDAFLSDILEETYHKKRNEAILLSMQRQNKSHITSTQNNPSQQINEKQNHISSSFSSSHHCKLCTRCHHIFINPKKRINQILQLYHIERQLIPQNPVNPPLNYEHKQRETPTSRPASRAIFYPSITNKLFDFSLAGHAKYKYKYIRKHINLPNIYEIINNCIISDHSLITLSTINKFNRAILGSQYRKLFIMYQLLQLFAYLHHQYNLVHGHLSPSLICINPHNLLITVTGWFIKHNTKHQTMNNIPHTDNVHIEQLLSRTNIPNTLSPLVQHNPHQYKQDIIAQSELLRSIIYRWIHREISNFEYVLELNKLCGRMKGDPFNHPVLPWVVDFTSPDGVNDIGWRDLTKSKFRLTKGDHQIDHTFLFSPQPHHITEVLSSLTYFLYLARRTPQYILQKAVRSRFEPKEYPISIAKLYQCVPEECIPEFYCDEMIFESMINKLPNLQIPAWCESPRQFIQWHRRKLESKQVSENLHLWIDLNFGYRLGQCNNKYIFGYNNCAPCVSPIQAAINCKNIPLQFDPLLARHCGVIQLFNQPHPPQISQYNKIYNPLLDQNCLCLAQSMQIQRRIVEFGNEFLKLYVCSSSPESLGFVLTDKDNTLSFKQPNTNNIIIPATVNNNITAKHPQSQVQKLQIQTQALRLPPKSTTKQIPKSPAIKLGNTSRTKSFNKHQNETHSFPLFEEKNIEIVCEENIDLKPLKTRNKTPQGKEKISSSTHTDHNLSYFAYDASGHGYVGYLNEDSRKRVGIISPETHYANVKDDIFSLGCIMASVFTGKSLFCYNSLKKHLLGIDVISGSLCKLPPVVSSCIISMVHRDPSKRPDIGDIIKWDSLFVYGMKEMYDLIQYIHEFNSKYQLLTCISQSDTSISEKYIALIKFCVSSLKLFPEMHPELFALIVPYLIEDIPIWDKINDSLLHYFKMIWCISSKLSEELCCYLLKKPFLSLLSLSHKSHELIMELLKPNTANFIRNHFGEYNFSKYYMKTIRLSLKSVNISIRKNAEIFLMQMNKFMELKLIENSIIDPILNDLNNNIALNPQEIRSFMMITQSRGEIFITKHVIPKMLNIINEKIIHINESYMDVERMHMHVHDSDEGDNASCLYVIFAILELLIYLLKPHRNRKFVFQTGLKFTDNTAIFKCLRLPLSGKYFNLIEFKKLILLTIRIAQFFGPKSEITQSLLKTLEPMMILLKERVRDSNCASFHVYTSNDCRELLFMIYTSFQSIFSEKQLDSELDQIEIKSSKQIKRIVLHYMEQRRSINNNKKDKKQTVSLKDHSPPILEPSTWKINVHSSFYQQIKDKNNSQQISQQISPIKMSNTTPGHGSEDELGGESSEDGENIIETTDDEQSQSQSQTHGHPPPPQPNNKSQPHKQWQFKANIHHIIQGHQPSTRILTIESKKNANLVLTGGSEGNIRMWRVEYSKLRDLTQYTQHLGAIKNISFLKYTDQIASCCGEIHVWDSAKCETIRKFTPHSSSKQLKQAVKKHHSHHHHHHKHSLKSQSMNDLAAAQTHNNPNLHMHSHSKIFDKYTCMTPFNYCCLLAGNQKGRIEFLDINTRSCSYDWEILPHNKLNIKKHEDNNVNDNNNSTNNISHSYHSHTRRVTAIAVRNNQREVAVGLSDGQIVILDLRNGFIVESFHEFNAEITKLYWSNDNILIALCRDEGLYVFNCNQISRLYLESCSKFKKYPKEKLFLLDDHKIHKKNKKSKLVTIKDVVGGDNHAQDDILSDKNKLHQQISKKLIEIGDASTDNKEEEKEEDIIFLHANGEGDNKEDEEVKNKDNYLFNGDSYFETCILNKNHKIRQKDVAIRTLLLNPNFNGDIDDYSRYTEHIRAYHSYINNNNSIASSGMKSMHHDMESLNHSGMKNNKKSIVDGDKYDKYQISSSINDEISNCNNLLPFTPIISQPFLFNNPPQIIAKYEPNKFDTKSLKTIKTNLSQYKITDFGLYKSNVICSIGKGIGYAKLKTPTQILKEPTIFTQTQSNRNFAKTYNSKMITRSFPSLKTKSSLSSLSILENMHLVIIGTNNGKVFTCG